MHEEFKKLTKKERRALKKKLKQEKREKEKRNRKIKKVIFSLVIILLIIGGLWRLGKKSPSSTSNNSKKTAAVVFDSDHIKGAQTASVSATLIEYSDFQCPACGTYSKIVKQLIEKYIDNVQFVYRHFPLKQIHQNAELAARTAEAAGNQNKFWEMHDIIFNHQDDWSKEGNPKDTFISYAKELELDVDQFVKDLDSAEVKNKVENDYKSGIKLGVNATPTFFLNGKKINNPRGYKEFKNIIEKAISD